VKEKNFNDAHNTVEARAREQQRLSKSLGKVQMGKNLSIEEYFVPDAQRSLVAKIDRVAATATDNGARSQMSVHKEAL